MYITRPNINLAPEAQELGTGGVSTRATIEGSPTTSDDNHPVDPPAEGEEAFDFGEITSDVPAPKPSVYTQQDDDVLSTKKDERQVKPVSTSAKSQDQVKPVAKTQTQQTQQQTKSETQQSGKRDYSKITNAEDLAYAKTLPNHIFTHVAPILEKKNAIERQFAETQEALKVAKEANPNRIPDNWYDHEEAFTLAPEYKEAANLYSRASIEADHWRQQLIAIDNKADHWYGINYDNKTGQYSQTGPFGIDAQTKRGLEDAYHDATKIKDRAEAQAESVAKSFKDQVKAAETFYQTEANKRFEMLDADIKPKDDVVKLFIDGFIRPAHRSHPLAKLSAQMFSVIANQGDRIGKLMAESTKTKQLANDRRSAGPTSRTGVAGTTGKNGVPSQIDFDALTNEMQGD